MSSMSAEALAAHPCLSTSLAYSGGQMAAAGSRIRGGPSGVVAARGVKLGNSPLAVGGTVFPHLALSGMAALGDRSGGCWDWKRVKGATWP